MFALSTSLTTAIAELKLQGSNAELWMGDAVVRASCRGENPEVTLVTPTSIVLGNMVEGQTVQVDFHNVAPSCAGVAASTPCASTSHPNWPARFECQYRPQVGDAIWSSSPQHAFSEVAKVGEEVVGIRVALDCPVPPYSVVASLGGPTQFDLVITHLGVEIPWGGVPDGQKVTFDMTLSPPPSSPPQSPPPLPPPPLPPPFWVGTIQMPADGTVNGNANGGDIWNGFDGGTATTRVKLSHICKNPLIAYHQHSTADETISGSYFILDEMGNKLGATAGQTLCFCKNCWCTDDRFTGLVLQADTWYHLGFSNNPTGDMSGPSCYRDANARTVTSNGVTAVFDDPRKGLVGQTLPTTPSNQQCRWMIDCSVDEIEMPPQGTHNGGTTIWSSIGTGGLATTKVRLSQECANPLIAYHQHETSDESISGSYFITDSTGNKLVESEKGKQLCFCKGCWCPNDRFYGFTMAANTDYHFGFLNVPNGDMSGPSCYDDLDTRVVDNGIMTATFSDPRDNAGDVYPATSAYLPRASGTGKQCRWKLSCGGPGVYLPLSGSVNGNVNGAMWASIGSGGTATTRVELSATCANPMIAYYQHVTADEQISGIYFIADDTASKTVLAQSSVGKIQCFCKDCWCPDERFTGLTLEAGVKYHLGFYNNPAGDMSGPACYTDTNARTVTFGNMQATFDDPRDTTPGSLSVPVSSSHGQQCRWLIDCSPRPSWGSQAWPMNRG